MKDKRLNVNEDLNNQMAVKSKRIKKQNVKYFLIFIGIMVLAFVIGMLFGKFIKIIENSDVDFVGIITDMRGFLFYAMSYIHVGINLLVGIVSAVLIRKSKKLLAVWDGEDEEQADKIDGRLGIAVFMAEILMVVNFFLFALAVNLDFGMESSENTEKITTIVNLIIFILSFAVVLVIQKKAVDLTKLMNPEKDGSIYDGNFNKKWEESCDEAEKLLIYKCGYKAFKCTSSACLVLWVLCVIGDMAFDIGLLPVIMVTVIWLVQVASYTIEGMKH